MGVPAMPRLFGGACGCDEGAQGDGQGAQCDGGRPAIQGFLALFFCLVRWRDEQVRLGRRQDENRRESFHWLCLPIVLCVEQNVKIACLTSDQVPIKRAQRSS